MNSLPAIVRSIYPTVAGPFQRRGTIGLSALSVWDVILSEKDGAYTVAVSPVHSPGDVRALGTTSDSGLIESILAGSVKPTIEMFPDGSHGDQAPPTA